MRVLTRNDLPAAIRVLSINPVENVMVAARVRAAERIRCRPGPEDRGSTDRRCKWSASTTTGCDSSGGAIGPILLRFRHFRRQSPPHGTSRR